MSSIISVSNLSKAYRIGKKAERADSFVGMLQDSVTAPFRNWRRMRQPTGESRDSADELHWALKDVSFEVKEGEVLGVIGRNGAGKSTLLKILSRITEPTSGEVRIRGRVASLLEVGTGFHPELTGRENVYLNGTILGMTKKEIDKKFDEIVDFSGVEKFLDTPVKRYSSGMKVRLAFAVASNLDPEILIVDEVLAVGDSEFQKKCVGKMSHVASSGRTVLFVSHSMQAVRRLCNKSIYLTNGLSTNVEDVERSISRYNNQEVKLCRSSKEYRPPIGDDFVELIEIRIPSTTENQSTSHAIEDPTTIEIIFRITKPGMFPRPNLHFHKMDGEYIFASHENKDFPSKRSFREPGIYCATCVVPENFFNIGSVAIGVALTTYNPFLLHAYDKEALTIEYYEKVDFCHALAGYAGPMPGPIRPHLDWNIEVSEHERIN